MKKSALLHAVISTVEEELRRQQRANSQASDGATHSEARAETKWDTCGLESSYLARGYAMQFKALAAALSELRAFTLPVYEEKVPIGLGALVEVSLGAEPMTCFLLPCAGGTELTFDGKSVTVITPESPIGASLVDHIQGDTFSFRKGVSGTILSVG